MQLASGRVIAVGRLLLAGLFLGVLWIDRSGPVRFTETANAVLLAYFVLASALVVVTWRDWWLEAQLSGLAHAVDVTVFTALVYLNGPQNNPYYAFFIFVLLAAAIRWGWRATALTAVLLTVLHSAAGLGTADRGNFDLQQFVSRTGPLIILSLIVIWFGVNRWRVQRRGPAEELLAEPAAHELTLESALTAAMAAVGAPAGALVWARTGKDEALVVVSRGGEITVSPVPASAGLAAGSAPFLYDLRRDHAMHRDSSLSLRSGRASDRFGHEPLLQLGKGLAVPVTIESGSGQLYLEEIPGLSIDHLELGEQIGTAMTALMQRRALMKAAEESAEARSRVAIARDLHDSVVQFLAGTAFRLEAIKRSEQAGRPVAAELDELKQLMLQEQGELRAFIAALRSGTQIAMADLARDLQALAGRLSRQWDVHCSFSAGGDSLAVSSRVHLDAQQLVREAVANAVRHAGAKNISIRLGGADEDVRLELINDGTAFPRSADGGRLPGSLRERVEAAGGVLDISRGMGVTKLSISLPSSGRAA